MTNIPFSRVPMAGNELVYIKEVLDSGWLTTSKKAMQLEEQFKDYVGAEFACAVNSCTSALHLAVEAIGIGPGDKVLVPSLTFTASAEVIRYMDAHPVFLDVEYGTGLITPRIIEDAIAKHPDIKALIVTHYGGQAAEMISPDGKGILDLCHKNGITVVEDAAHAFPTKLNGRYVGSIGDVTCFSFYANKTITTGEGGMLLTNDQKIYDRVRKMRLHGIDRDIWQRFTAKKASWEYDVVAPGFKYNMPDVNAAIGLAQMEKAEEFREQRQRCAAYYFEALADVPYLDLPLYRGAIDDHSWHLFPTVILPEAPLSRNEFIERLSEFGIGTSVHYKPLHRMSYYQQTYHLDPVDYPNTERMWTGLVSLPIYPDLKNSELSYICDTIKQLFI